MITSHFNQPNKYNKNPSIYYRDSLGRVVRRVVLDKNGFIFKEYLYERIDDLLRSITLYDSDHLTILGQKKYEYCENSRRFKMTEESLFENEQWVITRRAVHEYDDVLKTSKVLIYGRNEYYLGYQSYGTLEGEGFMDLLGCYDRDGNKISCLNLEVERNF